MDLKNIKHIHFTGIKGVGLTAVAQCAQDLGIKVTGSDTDEMFVTDETLDKRNIRWNIGFSTNNLTLKPDLLITTGAHGGLNNLEVLQAKKMGIKVITYAEGLALFSQNKKLISVCGVGGKGTTASIISVLLNKAGVDTSFAIGMGSILPIGVSGKYNNDSDYFVCEADEYAISPGINNDPKFSILDPFVTVATNIEYDHPDIYQTFDDTIRVYKQFLKRIPKDGMLVANIDNTNTKKVIAGLDVPKTTYGFNKDADWRVSEVKYKEGETAYEVVNTEAQKYQISINLPGEFNVLNSLAAFIVALHVGVPANKAIEAIKYYQGARRRFEKMGVKDGAIYYDDYAHHPSEIKSVIQAAKEWYPKRRLIALFQPHTYSRTKSLFKEFSEAFKQADMVGIMDIYASARETKDESISSEMLAAETKINNKSTFYLGDQQKTLNWLKDNVKKADVVLTMGAGDIFHLYKHLIK